MMILRRHPILFLLTMLFFSGLACQAVTQFQGGSDEGETAVSPQTESPTVVERVDQQAIIDSAVATVSAQTAVSVQNTGQDEIVVETNVMPVDLDFQSTLISIYERVNPAVTHIFIYDEQDIPLGTGSGFLIDSDGNIVTNNHVISGAETIDVVFGGGERRRATIQGTDVDSDLAVINVADLPAGVTPVPLGDSSSLTIGEFVIAIGNPFGESGSMTLGIVSGLGRTLNSQRILPSGGSFSIPQVIQTDAAINPGNSGGPLLNLRGEVVGVNSAIQSFTGANSGVGFSVPVDAVKNIAPALIEDGRFIYSFMGISMVPEPFSFSELERLDIPANGVYITTVQSGSPADEAGLIGNGAVPGTPLPAPGSDYIREVNGVPVRTSDELLSYLVFETRPGDTIDLTILRDGEEVIVPLTLGERP